MTPYERGKDNCIQDAYENSPFASIGGLNQRHDFTRPEYISEENASEYFRGYEEQAKVMYGDNWKTVKFEWKPAIVIKGEK